MAIGSLAYAQYSVYPASPQAKPILIKGATAHLGNGQVIQNSVIGFDKGKLTIVADATNTRIDETGYEVIDASGKQIYPGFIIPDTGLGLGEVGAVNATNDLREQGDVNANVRSIVAYNTDSELIPSFRFNGILLAQITPAGGIISGQSSVVELDAWNWEDAAYKVDEGLHLNWPNLRRRNFDFATFTFTFGKNENYDKEVEEIKSLFDDARSYGQLANPKATNLKLAAMQGLFDGTKTLYIHDNSAKEIVEAIKFAKAEGVQKIALATGDEALLVKDFLKENNIPVIIGAVHELPPNAQGDYDTAYKLPGELFKAGLKVSIGYDQGVAPQSARNLAFVAGTAAAFGMGKEEALKAITLNTAEMLGIADRVGSLSVGKDATLFVSDGDALDMKGNIIFSAYIRGKKLDLDGMQQKLYRKYKDKYNIK